LIWYINGHPIAYFKGKFETPMSLFLNTSVAKDGGAFKPGPNEKTKWPNVFSIDYYRYWKPATNKNNLILKKQTEYTISDQYPSSYSIAPTKKTGLMFNKSKLKNLEGNVTFAYTSDYKLRISVLGKIRDGGLDIVIECNNSKKIEKITNLKQLVVVDVDKTDTQLKLTFVTPEGNYLETLILQ